MPFTPMHISDLHRLATDPIGHPELPSTLITDREPAARPGEAEVAGADEYALIMVGCAQHLAVLCLKLLGAPVSFRQMHIGLHGSWRVSSSELLYTCD